MAVEIPVFIDIEKAFQDAAARVSKSIQPLQEKMDKNALELKLRISSNQELRLKEILDDSTLSAKQLSTALADVDAKIKKATASGGFDLSSGLKYSEKIMLQAAGALEYKLNGVKDASSVMARIFGANIDKTKAKLSELSTKLDDLTRKQNRFNKEGTPGQRVNYSNYEKRIQATNAEIKATKNYLGTLTVELEKISNSSNRAVSSMRAMKTPAMEMAEQWRLGSTYVERYNASLGVSNSRLLMLIKSSLSLMAIHAATSFIRNVRNVTSEFEMQRVALGGIIQDTERAEALFKQIKAAAIQSPFEIKDLVTYTKQLSAYQIETDKLFDTTMKLADISAGLGVDMNRIILAYGQVRAASVLRGQELRQFTEAGIPLVEKLAEKFRELGREGTTTADVFDLISKRAVPFSMIEDIFNDMTSAGGIFYKMQEKQSETLKGQWMKLKDALSIMYDEIGNTSVVHGAMESLLKDSMKLLQNWREVSKSLGVVIASLIAYKVAVANAKIYNAALTATEVAQISALELNAVGRSKVIASLFGEAAATKVAVAMGNLYVKAKQREMMATNLFTRSLYRMTAALLANPYALAIAGIAALVAIIIRYTRESKEAAVSSDELNKSITSFDKAKSHAKDIDDLCDSYDKLSKKANKTKEEEEKLARVTKDLAKSYPGAVTGVNEHTRAIELDTTAIRERNKAVKEAIRLSLLEKKGGAEKSRAELQSEYDRISGTLERGTVIKGAYGGQWEEPLTEEDKIKFGERLIYLEGELAKFDESLAQTEESLKDTREKFTVPLPEFFGDAWRTKINSYSVLLTDATDKTKAFTSDQIKQFKSAEEAVGEAASEYSKLKKTISFLEKAIETATEKEKEQLSVLLTDAKLMQGLYAQILTDYNAWDLVKKTPHSGGGYKQDPFINRMQERIKFMQDFKKGYDDLNKYVSSSDALADISKKMEARGLALNISVDEQKSAAEGISEWYEKQMEDAFAAAKKHGAVGKNYMEFLRQTISDTTNKGKALKDFQKLIQSLFDAKTDYDTSVLKKNLEDSLQKVKNDIKRSETARNFYQDILDMTGDEELATTMSVSVYGGIGEDFKTRMQKQLSDAMKSLDASDLTDKMKEAFEKKDFDYILANLDKFPEKYRDVLKELADADEKYNADLVKNLLKSLEAAKTYGEKRVELAKQTAQRTAQIEELNAPESVKQQMREQNARKEAEEAAKLAFEAFKDTPMYVELFANLDRASTKMLRNMRTNLLALKDQWKNLDPKDLKELQSRLDEIDKQLATKNPFKALVDSIKEYRTLTKQKSRKEAEEEAEVATKNAALQGDLLEVSVQEYETAKKTYGVKSQEYALAKDALSVQQQEKDEADEAAKNAQKTANAYRQAAQHISDAAEGLQEWAGYVKTSLDGVGKIIDTFGSDKTSEKFGIISTGISDTLSGAAKIAAGAAKGLAGIPDVIAGVADVISGTFGAVKKWKIEELNDRIEEQERMLKELEYSYGRLDKVMGESFGSDYIYNYTKQLEVLQAKVDAYNAQAELERKKGKKADVDKIKDYEDAARDATDQIADMKHQLSEFFTGTDITSAAEDFANAWIEAYKEFGSTTDAMSEKFNDMIESMINKSLAAKIMQEMLQPVFDQIDEMSKDGLLGTEEIASIAALAQERIPLINDAMTNLMSSLASAGLDVRTSTAGFKGISKDIAGASEESILGLAAGINTQNFYMSFVPTISENVAAILSAMTGSGTAPNMSPSMSSTGEGEVMPSVQQMVYDHLPIMDQNISEMLKLFKSVITTKNSSTNTNYIAVR